MKEKTMYKKFLMSPYLFSLVCTLLTLVLFGDALMLSFWIKKAQGMPFFEAIMLGEAFGFFFGLALTLLLILIFVYNSFEYFGIIEIWSDRVVFRAVFRRPRVFLYSELKDIGIDYGILSGVKQFWIYFGKEPISSQYAHNILRLPYSKTTMRVQYRKALYDALLKNMPYDSIGKRLCRSHSIITLFRVETDD